MRQGLLPAQAAAKLPAPKAVNLQSTTKFRREIRGRGLREAYRLDPSLLCAFETWLVRQAAHGVRELLAGRRNPKH